ncbi:MAG TPA: septal ring lytic transglycosylase RlpA family protein [Burkholderiales bacterium]|nr:septal ring lytic transglycosylase RlpA family protein [Burkholderiales bacterium]
MAVAVVAIAGCSGAPSRSSSGKPGGYYLDDGPGANPPANLDSIPEPTPKIEPINKFASRPYSVLGHAYTPMTQLTPYKARGIASWYGKRYHGQKTSTGEVYDMYAMSAAHTTLPLPCYVRVTNLANGKSVVVRVNDRGPFHEDRLIDLSWLAAQRLGLIGRGSGMVEVEMIIPGDTPSPPPVAAVATSPQPSAEPPASVPEPAAPSAAAPTSTAAAAPPPVVASAPAPDPQTPAVAAETGGIYVQLGAFSVAQNAEAFLRKMRLDLGWLSSNMNVYKNGKLYRVHAGPYASREEANGVAQRVQKELGFKALVLDKP